jgi:hypothetical protein
MSRIFLLYFRRSLPWAGLGVAVSLLSIPALSRFSMFRDPDILLFFWISIMLPAACLLLGATAGAETASETASGAETVLPVSGFARLSGAALSATATAALISAVLLLAAYKLKAGGASVAGGFNMPTYAYLLTMLEACVFSFVFGRLSGSVIAGIAAGGGLALLTTSGILSSIAVDALIIDDARIAPVKIAMLALSALCGLASLKYISAICDRKARPGLRNAGAAALLLAAGLLTAGGMLAASKGRAERILVPAHPGDPAFAMFAARELLPASDYSLYLNPVREELVLLTPEGRLQTLLQGRTKSYAEFFSEPMSYIVRAHSVGENGETWVLLRDKTMRLLYAAPGGELKPAPEVGISGLNYPAMFRIGGKTYMGMRGRPDTTHYLAELVPGAKTLEWKLIGTDSASARKTIINMQKASGTTAWLSADGMKVLRTAGGRETELCRLPYQNAAFYHSPVYSAVRTAGRELFFIPLKKGGKTALYVCEKGKAPQPAWNAPEGYMFEFRRNSDGSQFTSISRRDKGEDVDRLFYILDAAGRFQPPVDADKAFAGIPFTTAVPVKAAGLETLFVLDHSRLMRLTGGGKPEELAKWDAPVLTWRTVKDGIIYVNKAGMFLVSWKGEKRQVY